ncbi:Uu.00g013140.m01.CDS01 [Anthostomella pinea]|uniref:Uu.00g013140.m01.CDS01 n=1 Tax=Anthostomella pinea TaxID=933095 RepID=A0AAI8VYP2_9PEZI|nr:Uu.00g013140.m01.CDS01 [Anthostomella pinea]
MDNLPYEQLAASKPFRILVGKDKKEFMMHAGLLAHLPRPLRALVNNKMKETNEGLAE